MSQAKSSVRLLKSPFIKLLYRYIQTATTPQPSLYKYLNKIYYTLYDIIKVVFDVIYDGINKIKSNTIYHIILYYLLYITIRTVIYILYVCIESIDENCQII